VTRAHAPRQVYSLSRVDYDATLVACGDAGLKGELQEVTERLWELVCRVCSYRENTLRELGWKTLIYFERAVPITPNAWYVAGRGRVSFLGASREPRTACNQTFGLRGR
jgi:hypothetical protein